MSKSVNVDFVTRQIEVDTDGKEHFISAAMAAKDAEQSMLSAQNAATSVKKYKALWFDNVAAMKAEPSLTAGAYVCTAGYYSSNDGGGASYLIRAKADNDVDDGGSLHQLANGLVAELIIENGTVNVKQFGATGNGITDDSNAIQSAINSGKIVYIPKGHYLVSETLIIPANPTDVVGKKRTSIIGAYNDTLIEFRGTGNAIENNGSLYLENIRIESLRQNTNGIFNSGTLRMYNCQSNGNGANGLMFDESVHVVHSIIEGCTFYGNLENGIRCVTNINWQKTSIRIYNCYCVGNGNMESASVAQNDLNGNGILLGACLGVSVIGTVCEYNHGSGILVRNEGTYAIMSVTLLSCYFEGNRLANIYLYSDQNTLYHKNILIKSNYYSAYPASAPDYYTNSLLSQSIETVIGENFKIIQSIVDNGYYDMTVYKDGNLVEGKPLKCKVVIYTTSTIDAGAMQFITYDSLKNQYLPDNTILAINASIGGGFIDTKGELYNDANSKEIKIRNTSSANQIYLVTIQFFYE